MLVKTFLYSKGMEKLRKLVTGAAVVATMGLSALGCGDSGDNPAGNDSGCQPYTVETKGGRTEITCDNGNHCAQVISNDGWAGNRICVRPDGTSYIKDD